MTNLLPLENWRRVFGFNPWHFWQLADDPDSGIVPVTSDCNTIVYQHNYQNADAVGREDILQAIETAESRLREYLGYDIAPVYRSETIPWRKYMDAMANRRFSAGADARYLSAKLPDGYVQAMGTQQLTLIGSAAVNANDDDKDGLAENWELTIATAETDPAAIAVYFNANDRTDFEPVDDKWRVLPVAVSIAAGVATVRGKRWQIVRPVLYEGFSNPGSLTAIDPTADANFVDHLDVYDRTTFTAGTSVDSAQAELIWETRPNTGWASWYASSIPITSPLTSIYDPAAIAVAVARVGIRDARLGLVTPAEAVRDPNTGVWVQIPWDTWMEPDRVTVRYLAGYPLDPDGQVARKWQAVVARFAAAEMSNVITACETANRSLYRWQYDMARAGGRNEEQYKISEDDLSCPFGTRAGHIYAWRQVRNLRTQPAVAFH